ncbi:MAG: hypothetical protein NTW42_12100, partial [Deltaproteobacteria bacterium]|nr:hypothetical protein [Deltaproteobacteria bacterium]
MPSNENPPSTLVQITPTAWHVKRFLRRKALPFFLPRQGESVTVWKIFFDGHNSLEIKGILIKRRGNCIMFSPFDSLFGWLSNDLAIDLGT